MLTAPAFRRRTVAQAWVWTRSSRAYAQRNPELNGNEQKRKTGRHDRERNGVGQNKSDSLKEGSTERQPSLIEQLFPERYAPGGTHHREPEPAREVPKIPTKAPQVLATKQQWLSQRQEDKPSKAETLRWAMEAQAPDTSVLVLRNAGKNLTEEDFRRVIPQGKHLEGWTLEQGDVLRVIPGRDLETLEQTGSYFLLFSSPLSAFTYQGHVTRIHRIVAANSPSSLLSPIAPPPGYMLEGMDAHDAINSFTLIAPDQRLQLRQLKPPLAPTVQHFLRYGGYEPLMQRRDRMPFEARLVLEGPQLQLSSIRNIMRTSGRDRGQSWSGNDNEELKIAQWQPVAPDDMPSPSDKKREPLKWDGGGLKRSPPNRASESDEGPKDDVELKRRKPRPVYTIGFATEQALHSFVHFWHGRGMTWEGAGKGGGDQEGDVPPVAHVQPLW